MKKKEFLEVLRQSLTGEVSPLIIEQNIRYYDQYINSQSSKGEEKVIEELGSPRLIARTIIDAEKAADVKGNHNNSKKYQTEQDNERGNRNQHGRNRVFSNLPWRLKLTLFIILLLLIIFAIVIGRIIIGIIFTFGVPILLIVLLLTLFKKR